MPTKTKPRRFKKTRKTKPKAIQRVRVMRPSRALVQTFNTNIGLPITKNVKLTYYDNIGLTSVSGTLSQHNFNLASIWDPDVTGVGHQPYGRDEWALLYKQYYVNSAKITVKFSNSQSNNMCHKVGLILDKDSTLSGIRNTRMEQTKGKNQRTLLSNSNNTQTVSAIYSPRSFFDIQDPSDDHQIKAPFTASPTLPAYACITVQSYDNVTTSSQAIYCEVSIDYNVVLFDPIPFAGS